MKKKKIYGYLAKIMAGVSVELYIHLSYLHNRGTLPNLKKPKDISEIILSTIKSGKINEYSVFVDKIKVRDYYKEWGFEEYLPAVYGIWENPDEIDFQKLPEAFALKTNHGCGDHYICRSKKELDIEKAKNTINKSLKKKYGNTETQYHLIKPLVFCEEYIDDGTGALPSDYKFLCLDGEIKCILVVTERSGNSYKLLTYDENWRKLDYLNSHYAHDKDFEKPRNLQTMIRIAMEIAKIYEFVRVDFYDTGERVLLGELTFTPQGGIMSYFTNSAIKIMGR